MSSEAMTVVSSTAEKYFSGASDLTLRKRLFLAMLEKRGRITYNNDGASVTWNVEYAQPPVQPHGASGEYEFSDHDTQRQLTVDVRGYVATDKWDYKNYLMNKGTPAIVNRYKEKMPALLKSLDNNLHGEFYIDGNAPGNENRLHGMLSFMGDDGATVAGDLVARPLDTYGGRSTALKAEGGNWSTALGAGNYPNATIATDWPNGSGDSEYDYLAPLLLNTTSTSWGSGTGLWADNCGIILRRATTWLTKNGGTEGRPDCVFLSSDLFNEYQDYQEAKYRNIVPHEEARDLGFPDTLKQEGVMIKYEFDVPAGEGFIVNVDAMELASWDSKLWGVRGPTYDIKTDAFLFKAGLFGNMRYQPKHFGRLKAYA